MYVSSRGTWLAFLDADDLWHPTKLERQVPETADPRVAVVVCRARGGRGRPLPRRLTFDDLWMQNEAIVSSSLVRRSAFEAAGGFWKERACEDYHLWLRLTAEEWEMANVPEDLVVYAPTAQSLSRQIESFAAAELACIRDIAARVGMLQPRLDERLATCYFSHAQAAIHARKLNLAKRFIRESMCHGRIAGQIRVLMAAWTPQPLLDLRRRVFGALRLARA